MDKYKVVDLIGEGSFGRVYTAKRTGTNEIFACKVIVKKGRSPKEINGFKQECEIQRKLNHPNIVRMLDTFETDDEIFVFSEFVERELYSILGQEGRLLESRVHKLTCDLISALFYLHSHRVLHRDLKPQNVLVDRNEVAKLCDFGFARSMGIATHVLTSVKGTPLYMAPEIINAKPYDHTADLWSLGCIIYELLVGKPPFYASSILRLACLIQNENIQWPANLSPNCKDFLQGLLNKDPAKRMTWPEILEHPYLQNGTLTFENEDSAACNKYPFTSDLSASQLKAKDIQRTQILENHAYANCSYVQPFYVPPVHSMKALSNAVAVNSGKKNNLEPVIGGKKNIHPSKTSSCPSVKVNSSLADCSQFQKPLHSSLKSVDKSIDISSEKKLYTSFASDFNDLKITECANQRDASASPVQEESTVDAFEENSSSENGGDGTKKGISFKKSKTAFTLHSWDSAASVRPIENEEWLVFLQRNMEEIMAGQLDCLRNHNLVSVVVAPLRNSNASSKVLEYVANMLSLPFVVDGPTEKDLDNIKQVYLEIKVIPNLIYASKIVARNRGYDSEASCPSVPVGSEMLLMPVSELGVDELQALEYIYLLVCSLVYSGEDFLIQFCDAAAILNAVPLLQQFLLLGRRKARIVTDLLAILNLVLYTLPENADLVEHIVLGKSGSENNAVDLSRLLANPSRVIRSRTCDLIKQLGAYKPKPLQAMLHPRLFQDLNALLGDSSKSVRLAAEEALKEIRGIIATNS